MTAWFYREENNKNVRSHFGDEKRPGDIIANPRLQHSDPLPCYSRRRDAVFPNRAGRIAKQIVPKGIIIYEIVVGRSPVAVNLLFNVRPCSVPDT